MRRPLLLCLLAALAAALLSPAGPAQAATPTMRIVSPTAGSTVSGLVEVVVELAVGTTHPALEVVVGLGTRTQAVPVAADACVVACTVTAALDTLGTSPERAGVADGPGTVQVSAEVGGDRIGATSAVRVLNERPTGSEPPHAPGLLRPIGPRLVVDALPLAVQAEPGASGSPVVAVEWVHDEGTVPLTRAATGRWSASWSTADLPLGASGSGYYVVRDARGARTFLPRLSWRRVAGPAVSALSPDDALLGGQVGSFTISHQMPEYVVPGTIRDIRLEVDGQPVPVSPWTPTGNLLAPSAGGLRVAAGPLPAGPARTLRAVLTDSTGRSATVQGTWTVRPAPVVTLQPFEVVDGRPFRIRATVTAPAGTISGWTVWADGRQVASSTGCPCGSSVAIDVAGYARGFAGLYDVPVSVSATVLHPDGVTTHGSLARSAAMRPYLPATPFVGATVRDARGDVLLTRHPDGTLPVQVVVGRELVDFSWTPTRGWTSVRDLVSVGDLDGDGLADVLARTSSGDLNRYEVQGQTVAGQSRIFSLGRVGTGWSSMRDLHGPGDWNGDGRADLLARDTAGRLWLYPGLGGSRFGARVLIGTGWSGMRTIVTPGDWTGDRRPDLLAVDTAGRMRLYPGDGRGGFSRSRQVGSGWSGMNALAGVNGRVYARDGAGRFWQYRGTGAGTFAAGRTALTGLTWY